MVPAYSQAPQAIKTTSTLQFAFYIFHLFFLFALLFGGHLGNGYTSRAGAMGFMAAVLTRRDDFSGEMQGSMDKLIDSFGGLGASMLSLFKSMQKHKISINIQHHCIQEHNRNRIVTTHIDMTDIIITVINLITRRLVYGGGSGVRI